MKKTMLVMKAATVLFILLGIQKSTAAQYPGFDNLSREGAQKTITVVADQPWEITTDGDWFSVYPSSGRGDAEVTVYIQSNPTPDTRTGSINVVIKGDAGRTDVIKLTQTSKPQPAASKPAGVRRASAGTHGTEEDFAIGYGYDIFGMYADYESKKIGQFFDYGKIRAAEAQFGRKLVANEKMNKTDRVTREGKNISELSKSFKIDAGIKAKYFQFAGEIKASFSTEHTESQESEFGQFSYQLLTRRQYFDLECLDNPEKYMTESALNAINGTDRRGRYKGAEGIKRLINEYGTHVITLAYLGGRVDYSLTTTTTRISGAYELDAFLKIGYGKVFNIDVSVETKYKESFKQSQTSMEEKIRTVGGNKAVSSKDDLKAWTESVYAGEHVLMKFEDQSLVPVWEFCDDPARRDAIEKYVIGEYYASKIGNLTATVVTAIDVPEFKSGDKHLVKKVTVDGVIVAEICNEYIPTLRGNERVTVIYPVIAGRTRLDKGFYIGSDNIKPAVIAWSENAVNPSVSTMGAMAKGKLKKIYKLRDKFYDANPDKEIFEEYAGQVADQYATGYENKYPVVKVGRYFWLGEDYRETKGLGGGSFPLSVFMKKDSGYFYLYLLRNADQISFIPNSWHYIMDKDHKYLIDYLGADNGHKLLAAKSGVTGLNLNANGYGQKNPVSSEGNLFEAGVNHVATGMIGSEQKFQIFKINVNSGNISIQPMDSRPTFYPFVENLRVIRNTDYIHH